ncbi:MAG: polysaccharide deacetylase family protein, partial [Salinivenus sp.]
MRFLVPYLATYGLRPIRRFFPDFLWRVQAQSKTAYLTFDDGPTAEGTRSLLDLLATYDARATHFLIGSHARQHPALVQDMVKAGHRLGNHTFTHVDPWRVPSETLLQEASRTTAVLEDIAGTPIRALRP